MGFSNEWEEMYKTGAHDSVWPWTEVVALTKRYFRDKEHLSVLELGCGAGANIPFFIAMGAEYYGIEGSMTQVEKLRARFPEQNVHLTRGDFTQSLVFDKTYDLVLDRSSITHNTTADIRKVISMAQNSLKKNGMFFCLDWFSVNTNLADTEQYEKIDGNTRVYHEGYFNGLGNVHFSDKEHLLDLFSSMDIIELYEKKEERFLPKEALNCWWSIVARKRG